MTLTLYNTCNTNPNFSYPTNQGHWILVVTHAWKQTSVNPSGLKQTTI